MPREFENLTKSIIERTEICKVDIIMGKKKISEFAEHIVY